MVRNWEKDYIKEKMVVMRPEFSFVVQKIAGHSNEKMTNYYTHLEEEHIDDKYERYAQKYGTET